MTNKEKYPKTEDALAAFRKHKEELKCDCTFNCWLGQPCDDEIEKVLKDLPTELGKSLGMALAGILGCTIVTADAIEKGFAGTPKTIAYENADIECPLCHGKRGKIGGMLTNMFRCPDCGALIRCDKCMSPAELAAWLSRFSKKQD